MTRYLLGLAAGLLFLAACSDEPTFPTTENDSQRPGMAKMSDAAQPIDVTDRYIVVFKDNVGNVDNLVDEMTRGNGAQVHFRYKRVLKGFAATIPTQALEGIRHNPNVDYIESDGVASVDSQSNPPSWGLDRIDQHPLPLDNLYSYPNNGSGVTVYIIDTGIRLDHMEYASRVSSGWDFVDNDADASDCHGHGTHVAGTVGGSNVGVAKGVSLVAVRVMDCTGVGMWSAIIAGINWVVSTRSGPAVINLSIGGGYSSSLNTAVNNAVAAGVVCAVAAGNENVDASTKSPASAASALTVGATASNDSRSYFSNYGSVLDIFAPGSGIYSSTMTGQNTYASWSGTSMATPHVAGAAALYLSANPTATTSQVENALKSAATSGILTGIGTGSPNLLLFNMAASTPPPPPPSSTPPSAPSALNAAPTSTTSIAIDWNDNATDETGFSVERSPDGSSWAQIASVGANTTSYSNNGLSSGATYHYRVRAFNGVGNSAYSNAANATTPTPTYTYVHVSAASGSAWSNKNKWRATLDVTVVDASNQPVSGATVTVNWSGGASGSGTAVTGSNGTASVQTSMFNRNVSSVTMTVSDISGSGLIYSSSANTPSLPVTVVP